MLTVVLGKTAVADARRWQAEVLARLATTPNYTGLEAPDRFFHGYLGELAVMSLLSELGCVARHVVCTNGHSQHSEITVWRNGAKRSVDVKTASQPGHSFLLFPVAQHDHPDLYVGARIEMIDERDQRAVISVHGYLSRDEALALPVASDLIVPAHKALLSELHSLLAFANKADPVFCQIR